MFFLANIFIFAAQRPLKPVLGRFKLDKKRMFRIPTVTKYLLAANIAVYALSALFFRGLDVNGLFGLHYVLAPDFRVWQLLTYMFLHGGFVHLFFNMFALWMFAPVVERTLGQNRFLVFYLVCGVGAGLFQEAAQTGEFVMMCRQQIPEFSAGDLMTVARNSGAVLNLWTTVGASGAIYAILLAFGLLYPDQRIFIFPLPIPIKAKWFVLFYAAIELVSAVSSSGDGVAHVAHLGGMVFGWLLIRYYRRHPFGTTIKRPTFVKMKADVEARIRDDWDYKVAEREKQRRTDAILDKIRKSGYDSLTTEEKQTLFDNSR